MKDNESLTVKFTNLTKTQKETLQQMFAYMQWCTKVGANRCIGFFWDAGWGMKSEILFSDEINCTVPLDIDPEEEVFFDLSEGVITKEIMNRINKNISKCKNWKNSLVKIKYQTPNKNPNIKLSLEELDFIKKHLITCESEMAKAIVDKIQEQLVNSTNVK